MRVCREPLAGEALVGDRLLAEHLARNDVAITAVSNPDTRNRLGLRDTSTLHPDIDGVQRLTRGHEQSVPLGTAKTDVSAHLRQANEADRRAVGSNDLHSGTSASPYVALHVTPYAISSGDVIGPRNRQLHVTPTIR